MNRDGGACNLPTKYNHVMVMCLSLSCDHTPDEVNETSHLGIIFKMLWLSHMNIFSSIICRLRTVLTFD